MRCGRLKPQCTLKRFEIDASWCVNRVPGVKMKLQLLTSAVYLFSVTQGMALKVKLRPEVWFVNIQGQN